jgi:2-dehydropantoate 2-reductase
VSCWVLPAPAVPRQGDVVKYMIIPQQPTTLGEIEGPPTPCIREIAAMLKESGFNVALSQNMDAWLKTHAVFVTAVCGALYCAGADNYELARSSETLALLVNGVREGLRSLRALGLPPPADQPTYHLRLDAEGYRNRLLAPVLWIRAR